MGFACLLELGIQPEWCIEAYLQMDREQYIHKQLDLLTQSNKTHIHTHHSSTRRASMSTHLSQSQTHNTYTHGNFNEKLHDASPKPTITSFASSSYGRAWLLHKLTHIHKLIEIFAPSHKHISMEAMIMKERKVYFNR